MLKQLRYTLIGLIVFLLLNFAEEKDLWISVILGCAGLVAYRCVEILRSPRHAHTTEVATLTILFLLNILFSLYYAVIDRAGGLTTLGFLMLPAFMFGFQGIAIHQRYLRYVVFFCALTLLIQGAACLSQALNPHLFQKSGWIDYNLYFSPDLNRSYGLVLPPHPLSFAMFMLPCVSLVNLYYVKEFYRLSRINLIFLTICLSAGVYSLLASGSRGPMTGFLVLFFGIVAHLSYRKAYEALFSHSSALACAMFLNFYAGHSGLWTKRVLNLMTDTSVDTRLIAWDILFRHITDVPFWGVGPGLANTSFFIQKYLPAQQVILSSYNIFIQYYLCLGVVGLGLFGIVLIMLFRNALRQWTQQDSSYQMCFSACVLSMIIAGMFESFIHHVQAQIMFSVFVALALTAGRSTDSAKIKSL